MHETCYKFPLVNYKPDLGLAPMFLNPPAKKSTHFPKGGGFGSLDHGCRIPSGFLIGKARDNEAFYLPRHPGPRSSFRFIPKLRQFSDPKPVPLLAGFAGVALLSEFGISEYIYI